MTKHSHHSVKNSDIIQDEIRKLYDIHGLSFRDIAALPSYSEIPPGTICSIYHGERVPNKWRKQLGLPKLVKVPETMVRKNAPAGTGRPRPPRIAIRKDDAQSAANSILRNFETEQIEALINELERMRDGR